jgi:hypothetical protein
VFHILVSKGVPASVLTDEERGQLAIAFVGDKWSLRRAFPVQQFPRLTGLGHRVESPCRINPEVSYLSLWTKEAGKWFAVADDPRLDEVV